MSEQLKPCPHCGCDADTRLHDWRVGAHFTTPIIRYAIDCPKGRGGCGAQTGWYEQKASAAAAWNRRTPESDTTKEQVPE